MRLKEIKQSARAALKGNWLYAALITFLFSMVYYIIPLIIEVNLSGGWDSWINDESLDSGAAASSYLITLVLSPLYVGFLWVFLELSKSGKLLFSELFSPFAEIKTYIKIVGTYVMIFVYSLLWTLLLVVPGIIKSIAYSQTFYVLKEQPELTINQAITESRRLMDGYKWKFFLLQLSFIGWVLLTILTLGIGLLWLVPYITASNAKFYLYIADQKRV